MRTSNGSKKRGYTGKLILILLAALLLFPVLLSTATSPGNAVHLLTFPLIFRMVQARTKLQAFSKTAVSLSIR